MLALARKPNSKSANAWQVWAIPEFNELAAKRGKISHQGKKLDGDLPPPPQYQPLKSRKEAEDATHLQARSLQPFLHTHPRVYKIQHPCQRVQKSWRKTIKSNHLKQQGLSQGENNKYLTHTFIPLWCGATSFAQASNSTTDQRLVSVVLSLRREKE